MCRGVLSTCSLSASRTGEGTAFRMGRRVVLTNLCRNNFFRGTTFCNKAYLHVFRNLGHFDRSVSFSLLGGSRDFSFSRCFRPVVSRFSTVKEEISVRGGSGGGFKGMRSTFLGSAASICSVSFRARGSVGVGVRMSAGPPLRFAARRGLLVRPHSFVAEYFALPGLFTNGVRTLICQT